MSITIGATITNALDTSSSTLDASHTTNTNTKALIVIIKGYDSVDADAAVTSLFFGAAELTEAVYYRNDGAGDDNINAVYYLSNPDIGTETVALTMGGVCTDISWDAVNLVSSSADTIIFDSADAGSLSEANSHTSTIDPAETASMALGPIIMADRDTSDIGITAGTVVTGSESDFGNQVAEAAYVAETSGTTSIVWSKTNIKDSWACSASFYEQPFPPTTTVKPLRTLLGVGT